MSDSAPAPRVLAQYVDDESRMEGRFTLDELIAHSNDLLPIRKIFVKEQREDGTLALKHLCNLAVSVAHPSDVEAPSHPFPAEAEVTPQQPSPDSTEAPQSKVSQSSPHNTGDTKPPITEDSPPPKKKSLVKRMLKRA